MGRSWRGPEQCGKTRTAPELLFPPGFPGHFGKDFGQDRGLLTSGEDFGTFQRNDLMLQLQRFFPTTVAKLFHETRFSKPLMYCDSILNGWQAFRTSAIRYSAQRVREPFSSFCVLVLPLRAPSRVASASPARHFPPARLAVPVQVSTSSISFLSSIELHFFFTCDRSHLKTTLNCRLNDLDGAPRWLPLALTSDQAGSQSQSVSSRTASRRSASRRGCWIFTRFLNSAFRSQVASAESGISEV